MKYRYCAALAAFLLPCCVTFAEDSAWEERLRQADTMRNDAAQRQRAADQAFSRNQLACQEKFLVNDCVNEARAEQIRVRQESREKVRQADAIERAVKREQLAARQAQAATDAEAKARNQPQRELEIAERDRADAARRNEIAARKARQAELGAKRKAEREAAHQRKVEAHARKVAAAEAKAAAKAAKP